MHWIQMVLFMQLLFVCVFTHTYVHQRNKYPNEDWHTQTHTVFEFPDLHRKCAINVQHSMNLAGFLFTV